MASRASTMPSGVPNTSVPDPTMRSISGAMSRTSTAVYNDAASTRRLQLKSLLVQQWLDWYTVAMAIKSSIPPAVLVCAIQSNSWIQHFKTNAYLAPIISACVMPAFPRAMLIEHNFRLTLAFVLAYCWSLFAGWCGVQARQNTTHDAGEINAYNSSAEAVVAIFLIFGTWCVFTLKSAFPSWALQCTTAGTFVVATLPGIARAANMSDVIDETSNVLECFLVGQAVGLVNALILFPQSSRGVFKKDIAACLDALVAAVRAQRKCMEEISLKSISARGEMNSSSSIAQLEVTLQRFVNGVAKVRGDVKYAAREISWGYFDHSQLDEIASLLVDLVPPVSGLSSVTDMLQLNVEGCDSSNEASGIASRLETDHGWQHLEAEMHQHSGTLTEAITGGVEHAKMRLQLKKGRSIFSKSRVRVADEEHRAVPMNPGEPGFLESYRSVFQKSHIVGDENEGISNEKLLDRYIQHRPQIGNLGQYTCEMHSDALRYFLFLHSQTLLSSLGEELFKLLTFLDDCLANPKSLLIPHVLHPSCWFDKCIRKRRTRRDSTSQNHNADTDIRRNIELGSAFYKPKNPDHLPPSNLLETVGDHVRKLSSVLRSHHATYGLRGVCAIMTIGIIAFLRDSQDFYFAQRFLWALFAILFSMARTPGSSTFLLLGRVLGTVASMITSYIIWYVVDEKIPGVLVLLWLWFIVLGYLFVKFPNLFSIWFVALVASIVMTANELQDNKLGDEAVIQAGLAVYPPYIIFPYRLAVVIVGVITAYFWTIFPYPLSEHSELRDNVANAMYGLARYSMCVQQTVLARLHGNFGDRDDKTSPGFHLQAARRRIFHKYQAISTSAKTCYQFIDWEFAFGGRFPKQIYGEMLSILERLGSYMTLVSYVSREFKASNAASSWWADDRTGTAQAHLAPEGVATRLIILHSALSRAHPLPPELTELTIPQLGEFLTKDVPADATFAAAALIHNVNWYLIRDVNRLTELVRELVGELSFSFTVDHGDYIENDPYC